MARKKETTIKKSEKFEVSNKVEKLKLLIIIVNKGRAIGINNMLIKKGVSFTTAFYGEGTADRYILSAISGDKEKEIIMCVVRESLLDDIKIEIEKRFNVSQAAKGVMVIIDLMSMAGVAAYKFTADFGRSHNNGKEN